MPSAFQFKEHFHALLDALSPRCRRLTQLRAKWGKPGDGEANRAARRFFDLTKGAAPGQVVDEKTWTDLEFPKVFAGMDSAETPLGSQCLYRQLRFYVDSPAALAERVSSYEALRADAGLREEIQLALASLESESNAHLASFIFGSPVEISTAIRMVPLWSLACLATLAIVLAFSLPIWVWLATVGVNVLAISRIPLPVYRDIESLRSCYRMLRAADGLGAVRSGASPVPALAALSSQAPLRARARRVLGWVTVMNSPAVQTISVWLNLIFLAELSAYAHAIKRLAGVRAELASTFEGVGSIDAAICIASYLERNPKRCQPTFSGGPLLDIVDGAHPLVRQAVANSIRLNGRSALITGSNMAGKTTFIKLVGINLILGRTLGFCLASAATLPRSSVMALIRGEHSVESGESHYFAEMTAIRGFIERAELGDCALFLIDELFSGTNTVERLAAGRAVLERLGAHAQVLVTTHDVELQDDISHLYNLYHFQEDPEVDGFFDYRLRMGKSTRRNAIHLLARHGFPSDLVKDALDYSEHYAVLTTH